MPESTIRPEAAASVPPTDFTAPSLPAPVLRGWPTTFRSLRHRNYRLYFFGQLVSLIGSWVQTTALMWLAHDLTGESTLPALVAAAQVLPTFLFGPWGGVLAERCSK